MASALSAASTISNEQRRWVVVGVCLTKVLAPALRNILATELQNWHHLLCQLPDEIDKQVYGKQKKKLPPSKLLLQYININNNDVPRRKLPSAYDYAVRDHLSLAKLFVQPFMSKFTGFDQTMDMSAILAVTCEADPFVTSGAAADAKMVRENIRNKWAHCNFSEWTQAIFNSAFQDMENLVKKMNMSPADEKALCDELDSWKDKGLQLCFGQLVDPELLKLVTDEVAELHTAVKTWKFESDAQMNSLVEQLGNVKLKFDKQLHELCSRIERCEKLEAKNSKELQLLDQKFNTELSQYNSKQEEKIPYIFSAPRRNRYFSGRAQELQELQRILKHDDPRQEKEVCIAAVYGMGGIGKTSLVAEYAHKMKDYYQGGVYWFSAEDDKLLEQSVNDIAMHVGALLGTFALTLTNTLRRIGQTTEPYLIVLDCLDQLDLSSNVLKFLDLVSRHGVSGTVVLMTRRNEKLVVDQISSLHKDRCLNLKCFKVEEAKQFVFKRTGLTRDENTDSAAGSLVEELGGLPLALEQAGACISALDCSLADYLEQYKTERLQLLEMQKANPISAYESPERLAVHTTWLLNIKHIKERPHGESAILLMNASAFLNPNEIEQELVNVGERPIEDKAFRKCVSSPLGCRQVVKLLTDFSLFMYVRVHSVSTHRLVQELVRENFDPEEKAKSFTDAVRMLSFAFSKCPTPKTLLADAGEEECSKTCDLPKDRSYYYLWSKLCFHGFYLRDNMQKLLENPDQNCLDSLFSFETVNILYDCAVHLSANQKQEDAKRTLNFAYRLLDWIPLADLTEIKKRLSNNSLFPGIPLPKWLRIVIKECCVPPISSLEPLDEKPRAVAESSESRALEERVEKLKSEGNAFFKDAHYKEAVDAYTAAIKMSKGTTAFNPFLLTNRASAYLKLNQFDDALNDANEYIVRFPECWKGYARKALALKEKVSAEIAAAIAYYYFHLKDGGCIFSQYPPFNGVFPSLKERIRVCNTANELMETLQFNVFLRSFYSEDQNFLSVIILGSKEYIIDMTPLAFNNCIMTGTKPDGSVTLRMKGSTPLMVFNKCMLTNLSFALDKGQINCVSGSRVKVLNCNFTCNSDQVPAVASECVFNAERSNFSNCKAGGLLCVGSGNMVVDNCTFSGNGKAGLEVRGGGILTARNSRMCNNGVDGLLIGPTAAECNIFDCQIYHNAREGIAALDDSKRIILMRNQVFGNDSNGIFVRNSDVDLRENKFFDNEAWGIWSQSNSRCHISMNEVFRNKRGGVRVGKRKKNLPPSVVELNKLHDNYGPGYVDRLNEFEDFSFFGSGRDSNLKTSGNYKPAKYDGNLEYSNEERNIVNQSKLSSPWCSGCFVMCDDLKKCEKCFSAAYCSEKCKRKHASKHKELCTILREKLSFLISSMTRFGADGHVNVHAKGLDEVGPKYSPRPPRDGTRFIVKVQTNFEVSLFQPHMLVIYHRSLDIYENFQSKLIDRLVKEFGVLCKRQYQEKKLFLYCVFEENGKLRLLIDDFAKFQTW